MDPSGFVDPLDEALFKLRPVMIPELVRYIGSPGFANGILVTPAIRVVLPVVGDADDIGAARLEFKVQPKVFRKPFDRRLDLVGHRIGQLLDALAPFGLPCRLRRQQGAGRQPHRRLTILVPERIEAGNHGRHGAYLAPQAPDGLVVVETRPLDVDGDLVAVRVRRDADDLGLLRQVADDVGDAGQGLRIAHHPGRHVWVQWGFHPATDPVRRHRRFGPGQRHGHVEGPIEIPACHEPLLHERQAGQVGQALVERRALAWRDLEAEVGAVDAEDRGRLAAYLAEEPARGEPADSLDLAEFPVSSKPLRLVQRGLDSHHVGAGVLILVIVRGR